MLPKILIFLVAAISVSAFDINDFILRNDNSTERECEKPGVMCKNCTFLSFCIELAPGDFIETEIGECPADQTCHSESGSCISGPNEECTNDVDEYEFTCFQKGTFPHALNCKKYYMCVREDPDGDDLEAQEFDCPEGLGYDVRFSRCGKILENDKCTKPPLDTCKAIGDRGEIEGNPSLYYICMPTITPDGIFYFPQIFQCPRNYEFFDGLCQDPTPKGIDNGVCIKDGNFIDASDCTKYFYCSAIGNNPTPRTCSLGYHFDPKAQTCIPYSC